jgi:thiamine-monophosphate kinase
MPLSAAARAWLNDQTDRAAGLLQLASRGDDYELLLAAPPESAPTLLAACEALGVPANVVGHLEPEGQGATLRVTGDGRDLEPDRMGFTQF